MIFYYSFISCSLTLFLGVYRASQSATYLRRVTENWDEHTITWNTQPQSTTTDQVSVPAPATNTSDFEIDVTNLVRIINDGQSNHGFLWISKTIRILISCAKMF
ncbi:DNRLRE domain-containing protein [Calditrichota bacterium GD2]